MKISEALLKIEKNISRIKFFSFVSYLGPLFIFGMIFNIKQKNNSLKFHIKQGFRLFLLEIIMIILYYSLKMIPYVGIILSQLFYLIAVSVCIVCILVGILHVILSLEQPLPYIGGKAEK